MLAFLLILLGVSARFIVHIPNFTPVMAIALFAGCYLSRKNAIIVPLIMMIIYDAVIGFHALVPFTWGSVVLVALLGGKLKERKSFKNVAVSSLAAAFLFYIVTNFGVWLFYNTYPKSVSGLIQCYVVAIPYFRGTLASTLIYSAVLFGAYEFVSARIKGTRLASAL